MRLSAFFMAKKILDIFPSKILIKFLIRIDTKNPPFSPSKSKRLKEGYYFFKLTKSHSVLRWITKTNFARFAHKSLSNSNLKSHKPLCHKPYFRKNNAKAIKYVFKAFVKVYIDLKLYERELIAVDGSKFRAVYGRKKMYNKKNLN